MLLQSERMRPFCFATMVSLLFPFLAALGGTLTSSPTRSNSQDLEVFNINADGSASVPRYYRFETTSRPSADHGKNGDGP
jgi:hypothetical protein